MAQTHTVRREKLSPFNLWMKTIALLNIDHYRKMLVIEQDETKRQTLLRLLAEEQAKLAAQAHPPNKEEHETC